ncbi:MULTISPECIES: toxin-antitoxin system HicB family antitoxin [unclassified Ornithinimicrobium]|uniref:toxin-antitoxin system HicB family antitoxin n=1 Tax=unclassified Ornithinimicrobium TaxID=2615080 RepID=UPI0038542B75
MDLTPYLDSVADDLGRATALADDHVRDVAHRLAVALEPGLRLALVRAVSDTAARVNTDLDDAVVTVTMDGRDPVVTVTRTGPTEEAHPAPGEAAPAEDGDLVRITLRLPEQLKARAEELAGRADQSLNTWLVQAVRRSASTDEPPTSPLTGSRRISGWA